LLLYLLKERIEGKIKLRIIFFQKKSSINLSFYHLILEKMYDLTFVIIEKVCNFLVFIIEKVYLCNRNILIPASYEKKDIQTTPEMERKQGQKALDVTRCQTSG